ncbi:MAG TPA: hypothetical protein VJ437_11165 [Acidiferrobacterales bacterium]|nr:hypothetical protein [Acidiferrobacterales bacterium]
MSKRESDVVAEFQTAIALHAVWPRFPLRRRLRAAWWNFADRYAAGRVVPVAEINNALYSQIGSVWLPYQ